jgi:glycosyltransferase involved in cell wall biosynthesis
LNPGLVGLVVLDSFVGEAPIITTTNNGIHSPEFSYIANGNNGMVVDCMPGEYNKAVKRVMDDDEFLRKLRTGCAASAEIYTIEKMVGNFTAGIIKATS